MNIRAERFLSLDVFRGLTICLMIIVNTPGSGAQPYTFLVHAPWFGFTLADLVFPSFLFAVGNALSFSIKKYGEISNATLVGKIVKRTLIIFLIGYLMYWFPFVDQSADGSWVLKPFDHTRVMGVLQRIALCYFFGALIAQYCSERTILFLSAALLLGYWAILYLFGIPGQELTIAGNAGTLFDRFLLGVNHMYQRDGGGIPFDPEGVLSTLPSIVNVLAGYLAGTYIQRQGKNFECIAKVLMVGTLLLFGAFFWNEALPISKKLWTGPFVLQTVGIDLIVLALLIYAIEMRNWQHGVYFFNVFGKNPLFIYLFSEIFVMVLNMIVLGDMGVYTWIGATIFQTIIPGPIGSLACAIFYTLVCWLVGFWLDRRRIYIKI